MTYPTILSVISYLCSKVAKAKVKNPKINVLFNVRPPSHTHTHTYISALLCEKICTTPPKSLCKEWGRNFYSRCIVAKASMSWKRCVFPNMARGVTFLSQIWGIRPIKTHWIAGQSEHTMLFRTMRFWKTTPHCRNVNVLIHLLYLLRGITCLKKCNEEKNVFWHLCWWVGEVTGH